MKLSDFNFHLPDELIAYYPAKARTDSRLLVVHQHPLSYAHRVFKDVLQLINPGDLLILNNTKVIPARLFARKSTGGKVEILVERACGPDKMLAQLKGAKNCKIGEALLLETASDATIPLMLTNKTEAFCELTLMAPMTVQALLQTYGKIPLPPYIKRHPEAIDEERYQTVYARHEGSVAAPTAGLHFDDALLSALKEKGVVIAHVTLHVGAGTFMPVRTDSLEQITLHAEYCEVSQALCEQIAHAKAKQKRIIAVGTTTLRALETAAKKGQGIVVPYTGETTLFIRPGYSFNVADILITNFHLPASTLLMLVAAFGGLDGVMQAYRIAVQKLYRFYSYGDAMLVERLTY